VPSFLFWSFKKNKIETQKKLILGSSGTISLQMILAAACTEQTILFSVVSLYQTAYSAPGNRMNAMRFRRAEFLSSEKLLA